MALVCFISQKGSPGATTTALAVAAAWPLVQGRQKLFVEADPFGGVLAVRYQMGIEPGLLTLAAAVRADMDDESVWDHAQELPGGLPAIIGPDSPDQANAVLSATGRRMGAFLSNLDSVDVIADVGRVASFAPSSELLQEADLVLMVAKPEAENLQPSAQRILSLGLAPERIGWVLVGERPHGSAEIEATFGVPVAGVVADDRRGAEALTRGASGAALRRSAVIRTASTLANDLAHQVGSHVVPRALAEPDEVGVPTSLATAGRRDDGS